ncbi:hypothetical protein CEXT_616191 [Caerostris extrusa]|uniref:Uncharacterized protein n=1 Tax=Caerostris extrusa TaxID=172846 RepID=A0AAV4NT70_CAEEX|nr:hypothetical protein CEXT_616191 [Caerostris extrusa]
MLVHFQKGALQYISSKVSHTYDVLSEKRMTPKDAMSRTACKRFFQMTLGKSLERTEINDDRGPRIKFGTQRSLENTPIGMFRMNEQDSGFKPFLRAITQRRIFRI